MNFFKTLAMVGLVGVGGAMTSAFADEINPIISVQNNEGSFYYPGQFPGDTVIWKAPLLRIRTNLTPFPSYWATHFGELHFYHNGIQTYSKSIIPENVTESIPKEFFVYLHYAVDGSDLCFPASKGVEFKKLANSLLEITPLPYQGKICAISYIQEGNMVIGYRISILDEKSARELNSFSLMHDPQKNNIPTGDLQWINERYILQVASGRRGTSVNLIDLKAQKIKFYIQPDFEELASAFVQNGKVMFLQWDGLKEYPLNQQDPLTPQ
jgi:hypothetical protein